MNTLRSPAKYLDSLNGVPRRLATAALGLAIAGSAIGGASADVAKPAPHPVSRVTLRPGGEATVRVIPKGSEESICDDKARHDGVDERPDTHVTDTEVSTRRAEVNVGKHALPGVREFMLDACKPNGQPAGTVELDVRVLPAVTHQ